MVIFVPMNFPSTFVLDRYGLRVGVIVGMILLVIGLWIRVLINYSFWYVIAGQTVLAISQPFLYNAPIKVTGNWFGESERPVATMIGTSANILGVLLGFLLPKLFVRPKYDKDTIYTDAEVSEFKHQVMFMLFCMAVFASVLLLVVLVSFKDKPERPPTFCPESETGRRNSIGGTETEVAPSFCA